MRCLVRLAIVLALMFGTESLARSSCLAQDSKETGTVSGRVLLDGKPAPGVIVMATPSLSDPMKMAEQMLKPSTSLKTLTDSDGHYRFEALPAGKYYIEPSAPTLISAESDAAKQVTVAETATTEDINFSLSRGGVITGKVTDSEGNPVIAEEISLKQVDTSKPGTSPSRGEGRMYSTDDRGIYRIFGLAPGRYVVSAGSARDPMTSLLAKRPKRVQTFYPGVTDEPKAKPVEVMAGGEASGIDIKLGIADKGFAVSGRVITAETGAPIANAMIAYSPGAPEGKSDQETGDVLVGSGGISTSINPAGGITSTNAKGEFRLESLSAGKYKIEVESMGALTGASEFYVDPINLEIKSANVDKLEIKVYLGASLSGVVVVENSNAAATIDLTTPLVLVAISDARPAPNLPRMGRVAADGTFRIGGLKAGKINIHSVPVGVQKYSVVRIERDSAEQPEGIDIHANEQITGVRVIVAPATCVIRGRVTIEGGTLPSDSDISVWARPLNSTSDSQRSFSVDAKGNFVIENLAPGDYEVEVSVNVQGSGSGRRLSSKQSVTVTAGVPAEVSLTLNLKVSDK
jgi:protocatechuate 3,4-dioxygenase beta subunit